MSRRTNPPRTTRTIKVMDSDDEPEEEETIPKKSRSSTKKKPSKRSKEERNEEHKEEKKEDKKAKTSKEEIVTQHGHEGEGAILEKGFVYFFYRPKVGLEEAQDIDDVQRLLIVLWPQGHIFRKGEPTPAKHHNVKRIIIIPKKTLPDVKHHGKNFAVVEKVSESLDVIDKQLGEFDYETKVTHQKRHLEGARPVGEGIYAIIKKHGHTHLAYVLELPHDIGEVQQAFHIEKEGSFIISVKNPDIQSEFGGYASSKKPEFPTELKNKFEGRRWCPVDPVDFLNYESAQVLLIGASADVVKDLGKEGEELEEFEKIDEKRLTDDKLFKELHLTKAEHPPEPLLEGTWK